MSVRVTHWQVCDLREVITERWETAIASRDPKKDDFYKAWIDLGIVQHTMEGDARNPEHQTRAWRSFVKAAALLAEEME